MLIVLLIGVIISTMKIIERGKQIFMRKNSKVETLMFHAFSSIPDKYQEKSFSSLKNISENFTLKIHLLIGVFF